MGFLRRLLGGRSGPGKNATPGEMLDWLQDERDSALERFYRKYKACPECESGDLRIGTWTRNGQAGWTVTCAACGHVYEQTTEIG